jgi:hypothetical protein
MPSAGDDAAGLCAANLAAAAVVGHRISVLDTRTYALRSNPLIPGTG